MRFFTAVRACIGRQRSCFIHSWAALGLALATAGTVRAQTTTFVYSGAPQYYDVLAGVALVRVVYRCQRWLARQQ